MKQILSIALLAVALCSTGYSQTETNVPNPILDGPTQTVLNFLANGSNWVAAPYAIYDTGTKKAGAGLAALVRVNEYLLTGLRFDYLNDELWMPSFGVQLQAPVRLGKVTLRPLITSGVATPIGSSEAVETDVVAIFGAGLSVSVSKRFGVFGHYEKWTGFQGNQLRGGFYWVF